MTSENVADMNTPSEAPHFSESHRFLRVFLSRPAAVIGSFVVLVFVICAFIPNLIAPYDPILQDLSNTLSSPSSEHWLGTDTLGRDMLSRMIYGARTAAIVGVIAHR